MSKISIVGRFTTLPGRRKDLEDLFSEVASHPIPGREVFVLSEDNVDADVLWVFEIYTDQNAIDSHRSSQVVRDAAASSRALLVGTPEIRHARPIAMTGV
jgi:quinol monooxygenase YgiN